MQIENGSTPILMLLMTDPDDNETAVTDQAASVAVSISKNGGTFATPAGSVSEVGRGWYKIQLSAEDTNTDGPLIVEAEVSGASNMWRWEHQVFSNRAATLSVNERNAVADHVLRRQFINTLAASGPDADTRFNLIGMLLSNAHWRLKAGDDEVKEVLTPAGTVHHEEDITYAAAASTGATSVT